MKRTSAVSPVRWVSLMLSALMFFGVLSFASAEETPADGTAPAVQTADSQTGSLSARSAVVEGRNGGVPRLAVFANAEGRIRANVSGMTGYFYVNTDEGSMSEAWQITCAAGDLCALMRIGNRHFAAVLVTARQSGWASTRPDETVYLWIYAYNASRPVILPAGTAPRTCETGPSVSFATGIPGAEVTLVDGDGIAVTTAFSDENGDVVFDAAHSADGLDHPVSVTRTFGGYDYHAATAYASDPANLLPAAGGTSFEWVENGDCATYQSRILTAGGFPVYAPYASSSSSPGGSLSDILRSLVGEEHFLTEFTAADLHEGDIVWGHNMGHALYCAEVDPEAGAVHTYAHSTSAGSTLSDNGWSPIADLDAVAQMVYVETASWDYRINGLAEPRLIRFDADGGEGEMASLILAEGDDLLLPENGFGPPAGRRFAGWRIGETVCAPGEILPVTGHMTVTACWREEILDGVADLRLPEGTLEIGTKAFAGIAARSVYIPDGCVRIGAGAFRECRNLAQIRIPADCDVDPTALLGCLEVTVYGTPGSSAEALEAEEYGIVFVDETLGDAATP